jgi:hypothetical protein
MGAKSRNRLDWEKQPVFESMGTKGLRSEKFFWRKNGHFSLCIFEVFLISGD